MLLLILNTTITTFENYECYEVVKILTVVLKYINILKSSEVIVYDKC